MSDGYEIRLQKNHRWQRTSILADPAVLRWTWLVWGPRPKHNKLRFGTQGTTHTKWGALRQAHRAVKRHSTPDYDPIIFKEANDE